MMNSLFTCESEKDGAEIHKEQSGHDELNAHIEIGSSVMKEKEIND